MTGPRPSHGAPDPLLRQLSIVALLVGALVLLHHFAVPSPGFDPRGLLAFGFVVLASYTIGALVDIIKLPHITGYLLAGMVFGPSFATLLPDIPPFDQGVLNREVIEQLSLLDALAVALIALNAGGELKLEALRSGLRAILGILFGQFIVILLLVSAFLVLVSGMLPAIALPGMGQIDLPTAIALGAVVSCVSFATSPAATL
ncbi:MAG: cation:proton antiporter, partial [Myxococcales bacterium]|nr:cation:proton antiporter [Myxococcales bacterium]